MLYEKMGRTSEVYENRRSKTILGYSDQTRKRIKIKEIF